MRIIFFILFIIMVVILGVCAKKAFRSRKAIGRPVALLLGALIPPVIGNSMIVISGDAALSTVGYYIYFLGMNCVFFALIHFTFVYCSLPPKKRIYKLIGYALLALDTVQLLCNTVWGHAFGIEMILEGGFPYYRLLPYAGQTLHRVVDYGILAVIVVVFFLKAVYSPRINAERYYVILLLMIVIAVWETFYIFSRTPIDRSMIGFGIFGISVFYFAIYYRPMRLLDSLLSHIASALPEALFYFDPEDKCIWANQAGIDLVGIEDEDFEVAFVRLKKLYGENIPREPKQYEVEKNGEIKTYVVEKREIIDELGRLTGSFISVRDNTSEQMTLRAEVFKATHDPLTGVYNRAGYNVMMARTELWKTIMLLIDGDGFKNINDTYGHEIGDKILQKLASTMKRFFRSEDCVCRIGGDEFVVLMVHSETDQQEMIQTRIEKINQALSEAEDGLPPITVSVGIAHGRNASDAEELFEHADKALYETKSKGKNGFTFFEEL